MALCGERIGDDDNEISSFLTQDIPETNCNIHLMLFTFKNYQ